MRSGTGWLAWPSSVCRRPRYGRSKKRLTRPATAPPRYCSPFLQDGWGEVTVVGSPIEFAASPRLTVSAAPQLDEYSSAQFGVKQDKADA